MRYPIDKKELDFFRPCPFLFITTAEKREFTDEKIEESLSRLKQCGFGGFVLFNKPPTGFDKKHYLSKDWFFMTEGFARAAKKLSLVMWINDGYDYPPGNVAGRIEEIDPTLKQKHIFLKDGKLCVREADWGFPAFEHPGSAALFQKLVYEEYEKHVGQYFGDPIIGFFSDADNRRVQPGVMFDEKHPARDYFPWSDDFARSFSARYGYDILPYMPDVLKRKSLPQAADYWEHAGRLYQSWFASNRDWLHAHGLLYTGHTSDSSPFLYRDAPRCSCFTEGRFSDIQSIFDYPGTDQELLALDGGKHMRITSWYTPTAVFGEPIAEKMRGFYDVTHDTRAKQAGSTAFLYGKKRVMCEMFAATNFGVSPAELKQIAAFQIMQGVNFVVPHAYHYRFFGETKYFAPPEFSARGMLGRAVGALNEEIAELCCLSAKGESVCPVVLLDPTVSVWENEFDADKYFQAFTALNRMPYGFAICDAEKIIAAQNKYRFKAAVAAGFSPNSETLQQLRALGVETIDEKDIASLARLIPCDVEFIGAGTPHFMRKNIGGEEFTFLANIENDFPLRGTLRAYGREKKVFLFPGDVAYLSAQYDNIASPPERGKSVSLLPEECAVVFGTPNLLPLERFTDANGDAVTKSCEEEYLHFSFFSTDDLGDLQLFLPESCLTAVESVALNGKILSEKQNAAVYDEPYAIFLLPPLSAGQHRISLKKSAPLHFYERIFLSGEFDVNITTDRSAYKEDFETYNLRLYIPAKAEISLAKRRKRLKTDCSWAKQGQPFYSGETTYVFTADLPENGRYRLFLPAVRDVAELFVNGRAVQKRVKPPYDFAFACPAGKNEIALTVTNSLANAMEYYLEESGLLAGGGIEKTDR